MSQKVGKEEIETKAEQRLLNTDNKMHETYTNGISERNLSYKSRIPLNFQNF